MNGELEYRLTMHDETDLAWPVTRSFLTIAEVRAYGDAALAAKQTIFRYYTIYRRIETVRK